MKIETKFSAIFSTSGSLLKMNSVVTNYSCQFMRIVLRFVVGFAVSLSAMSECLYISEISKPSNRGAYYIYIYIS